MALVSTPLIKPLALKISSPCIPLVRPYFSPNLTVACIAQLPCLLSPPHNSVPPTWTISLGALDGAPALYTGRTEAVIRHSPRGGWCWGTSASQLSCSWLYHREQQRELCNCSEILPKQLVYGIKQSVVQLTQRKLYCLLFLATQGSSFPHPNVTVGKGQCIQGNYQMRPDLCPAPRLHLFRSICAARTGARSLGR